MIVKKISYAPLWKLLEQRDLPKSHLCYNNTGVHITTRSLARLNSGLNVSIDSLLRICSILQVDIKDLCETITITE